jgi:hypothetical protein
MTDDTTVMTTCTTVPSDETEGYILEVYLHQGMDETVDSDREEFDEQSPEHRGPNRRRTPGRYSPVINIPISQL